MKRVDLNVDLGEGFPDDLELLTYATSANVCCGAHAGSGALTQETAERCLTAGVRVGAHPGYPDRETMGRAFVDFTHAGAYESTLVSLIAQVAMLSRPAYLKPHGALYNQSCVPGPAAELVLALLQRFGLPLMGLPGTHHEVIAKLAGVDMIREGFVDRAYDQNGMLVPRGQAGAVLSSLDEVGSQALMLAGRVDSLCLHGDTPGCVAMARHVRYTLEMNGLEVGF